MKFLFSILSIFLLVTSQSLGQCLIKNMSVSPTECDVNGDFYVSINFEHSGTSANYKVQGNGKNYGTFSYDSLPVLIGPLKADCKTNYEFVVRDGENNNCTAFKELGKKCCNDLCKITIKNTIVGACDNGKYSLKFDLIHNAAGVGFDMYNNGQYFGYYKFSELPITIPSLPSSDTESSNIIVVCANDNPSCCDTIQIANPCICSISKARGQVVNCNEQDSTFSLKLNFKHQLSTDSFQVGGNATNYGVYAYKDLPITISGLKFSNVIDYEFLIVDRNDAFCFGSYPLGFVKNCDFPCSISDIKTNITACDAEGNFYAQLVFSDVNTSIEGFTVSGNGQEYGSFEYGEQNYKIGPLKGDCQTIYEFLVKDKEIEGCTIATSLKDSVCCKAACALSNLVIKEFCDGDKLTAFEVDFDYSNNPSDMFSLRMNDVFVGSFKYSDLPLKITNINFTSTKMIFKIWDKENEACNLTKEYTFSCKLSDPCKIYDLSVTASACNDKGEFYAKIKFKHQDTGNLHFAVKVNGVLFDTFPYGLNFYEVGPLKGDCATLYKFLVYDYQYPDCKADFAFTEKVCCDQGDCKITDVQLKASECDESGNFYATIKFKVNNPGNQGFAIKVNGVVFDTMAYGNGVYEVGPLKGDCTTLYKFFIYDRQFDACKAEIGFTEKVCCDKGECALKDPLLTLTECEGKLYDMILDFAHSSNSPKFRVKVNGEAKGLYSYADLPITITGLHEKIAHEIFVWDSEDESCRLVFTVPGINCSTQTLDEVQNQIAIVVKGDLLYVHTNAVGIITQNIVYDMQGKICHQSDAQHTEHSLDISGLSAGMYIYSMQVGPYRINKKFVKY